MSTSSSDGNTVEIYPAVRRLATMLEIDFSYPTSDNRRFDTSYPEVQLMSLIVIATKLSHPFDDVTRYPESDSDPTTVKMDWQKWRAIMIDKSQENLKRGDEIHVDDTKVPNMSDKQMDQYLDWYQRTWIDGTEPKSKLIYRQVTLYDANTWTVPLKILEHFPLQDMPPLEAEPDDREERKNRLKEVQGSLIVQKPVPIQEQEGKDDDAVTRPGEFYRRYRNIDELPDDARAFYELAGRIFFFIYISQN
jgi:RNA polymerase I-specific transcription initiation factor RRN7